MKMHSILELETGYMDGWYQEIERAKNEITFWNDRRPELTHVVATVERDYISKIPDNIFLARILWVESNAKNAVRRKIK